MDPITQSLMMASGSQTPPVVGITSRYLRWSISSVRTAGNILQAAEFNIGVGSADVSIIGSTVTNPGGTNPPSEPPSNLVDGSTSTKWVNTTTLDSVNPCVVIFDFGSAKTYNSYRYCTANDLSGRDPTSWTVSSSDDGVNWTVIDTRLGQTITTSRFTFTDWYSITV
jgi:hypothetical protein